MLSKHSSASCIALVTGKNSDAIYSRPDSDRIGAFAEYALVRESAAAKKPTRLDYVQAASLPLVGARCLAGADRARVVGWRNASGRSVRRSPSSASADQLLRVSSVD